MSRNKKNFKKKYNKALQQKVISLSDTGDMYAEKGELDKAIEQYNKALAIDPHDSVTLSNLGNIYAQKGEFDKAIEQFNKALAIAPQQAITLSNLGNAYLNNGEYDRAIEQCNKALAIEPLRVITLSILGNIYAQKGELDKAIEQYNKALVIDPQQDNTLSNLGNAYLNNGEFDKAIEQCNKALAIDPLRVITLSILGSAYAQKGELDKAIEQFNKALAINPQLVTTLSNLGSAYAHNGEFDKAIEQFNKALAINPLRVNTLSNLGNAYLNNGEFDKAIEQCNKSLAIDPLRVNTLSILGCAYAQKGELDKAIEQFNKALAIDPQQVTTLSLLGSAYAQKGEYDKAIETYVNCIKCIDYDENFSNINKNLTLKINEVEEKKAAVKLIDNPKDKQYFANNIEEVIEIVIKLRNSGDSLFFRGQNDFRWKLSSTHERAKGTLMCLNEKLTQFKISIQALLNIEDKLDDGNYYALMQHYGIHTPLIDFSEFLNTALYFAVTDSNLKTTSSIPCVWVLIAKNNQKVSLSELEELDEEYEKYRNKILYPNLKDKRIRAQNGVFVWSDDENPINKNSNFELHQIIIFSENKDDSLILNQKIRDTLELSSTSATKIYPDDKGLAYEINYQSKGITSKYNITDRDNAPLLDMIKNNESDFRILS